jgi:hypothetical protein
MQNGHAKGNEQSYCAFAGERGTAAIAAATKPEITSRRTISMGNPLIRSPDAEVNVIIEN